MFIETETKHVGKWLLAASVAFTAVVILWVVLMIVNQIPGNISDQLSSIQKSPYLYKVTFVNASLISITLVPIMTILALFTDIMKGLKNILGVIFMVPYTVLVSIGYTSQYAVLPRILNDAGIDAAKTWFFGNPGGIPYFLVFLGYTFFSIGAILIGAVYLGGKGIHKVIGWLLLLSGITGIMGFVGLAANVFMLEQFMTLSGAITLPFGIAAAIYASKLKSKDA